MSRHSVKNALRCARATRGAAARAIVRWGRDEPLAKRLARALALVNAAEAELVKALGHARAAGERKSRGAA